MRALRSCGCGEEGPESIVALVREALRQEPGPLVQAGPPLRFGPASGDGRERSVAASITVERLLTSEELGDELLWIRAE